MIIYCTKINVLYTSESKALQYKIDELETFKSICNGLDGYKKGFEIITVFELDLWCIYYVYSCRIVTILLNKIKSIILQFRYFLIYFFVII